VFLLLALGLYIIFTCLFTGNIVPFLLLFKGVVPFFAGFVSSTPFFVAYVQLFVSQCVEKLCMCT
jgi:hypothetical protein